MRLILIALLVTLCQAIPKRPRLLSSGRLPRLSYSNFDERLLKVGITPDDDDLPFAEELPFKVQKYHQVHWLTFISFINEYHNQHIRFLS